MSEKPVQNRQPIFKSSTVSIGLFLLLFGCTATLFAWPWLPTLPIGGETLHRYVPLQDGRAALYQVSDAAGQPTGWVSINQQNVPIAPGFLELSEAELLALSGLYYDDGRFTAQLSVQLANEGAQFFRLVSRRVTQNGRLQDQTEHFLIRNRSGDYLLYEQNDAGRLSWLDPLLLFEGAKLPDGNYQRDFRIPSGDAVAVAMRYETVSSLEVNGRLFDDCMRQTMTFEAAALRTESVYCTAIGLVQTQVFDGETLREIVGLVSHSEAGWLAEGMAYPTVRLSIDTRQTVPQVQNGAPRQLFQLEDYIGSSEPSFAPTFVAAETPFILAAQVDDGLGAYAVEGGERLWWFKTDATIFGQPAIDPQRGRIYFGASDKKLYALDTAGLFLWAVPTRDNVVTRPVVVGERLLFGSEDGNIYCVHGETGRLLGQIETGGAVVASPAVAGETAVFGSDDGGVYAIDVSSCTLLWLFDAGDAVEAPLTIAQEVVFVVGRGLLAALRIDNGDPLWVQEPAEIYRFAPALLDDRLLLVDEFNQLAAFARADGRLLWTKGEPRYVGEPLVVDEGVLLMGDEPIIYLLNTDGEIRSQWPLPIDDSTDDPQLMFGTRGDDGRVYFVDDLSRVFVLDGGAE